MVHIHYAALRFKTLPKKRVLIRLRSNFILLEGFTPFLQVWTESSVQTWKKGVTPSNKVKKRLRRFKTRFWAII